MEVGMGVLGWTPRAFWRSTPHEIIAATDGFIERNGGRRHGKTGLTDADLADMKAMLDEDARKHG